MRQALESKPKLRRDCRGAVVVELAIMSPFLIFLLLTILDMGLLLRNSQIIENAAREGARYSSLPKNNIDQTNPTATTAAIKQRVIEYCSAEGLTVTAADVTINQEVAITVNGRTAVSSLIVVRFEHDFITPGASGLAGGPFILQGEAIFRNLF